MRCAPSWIRVWSACALLVVAGCDEDSPIDGGAGDPPQTPLAGAAIPQFAQPLPTLSVAGGTIATVSGNQPLTIRMCEFWAHVLPPGTLAAGQQPKTRVWGYVAGPCPANGPDDPALDTFTGPVIISQRSTLPTRPRPPTTITWLNELGTTETTQVLAYKQSTDQTLHWADPAQLFCDQRGGIPAFGSPCASNYAGPIPAVVHLHGGEVPPMIDGGPEAWFLSQPAPGYVTHGGAYYSKYGDEGNRATYAYPNTQEAATLWFHDHTLGTTTLNVYAGLAGAYLIVDPELPLPAGLTATGLRGPGGTERTTIPLVLQDRSFDTNGQLFYPAGPAGGMQSSPTPQHPYWNPEAFLDTIAVNGKVWPFLDVEPRRYSFLLVEGANSRAFSLSLVDEATGAAGPPLWVVANEEGYLDAPLRVDAGSELPMLPGERYQVIVDFSQVAPGSRLLLRNTAPSPFPGGEPPDPATTGRVMELRVGSCTSGACGAEDPSYDPAGGVPLLTGAHRLVRLTDPATGQLVPQVAVRRTRMLTLNELSVDPTSAINPATGVTTPFRGGPVAVVLNNTRWSGESDRATGDFLPVTVNGTTLRVSELPTEGTTEVWELVNLTPDAHPIHTHLTDFQIIDREPFDVEAYRAAYEAAFPGGQLVPFYGPPLDYEHGNPRAAGGNPDVTPFLRGGPRPPAPYESGWKDTVVALPGHVTRIAVRYAPSNLPLDTPTEQQAYPFDPSDWLGYAWHCHITTHEDNEMMRPFQVFRNRLAPEPPQRALVRGRDY